MHWAKVIAHCFLAASDVCRKIIPFQIKGKNRPTETAVSINGKFKITEFEERCKVAYKTGNAKEMNTISGIDRSQKIYE